MQMSFVSGRTSSFSSSMEGFQPFSFAQVPVLHLGAQGAGNLVERLIVGYSGNHVVARALPAA